MAPLLEDTKKEPTGQVGVVGLRTLPHVKFNYHARAPHPDPFATVWLPVNASNRVMNDPQQDIMHLYYSGHLDRAAGAAAGTSDASLKLGANIRIPFNERANSESVEMPPTIPTSPPDYAKPAMWMTNSNSLAPFATLAKPTCGYFFSRSTDHKKRLTGIPPTNTVKWRSHVHIPN